MVSRSWADPPKGLSAYQSSHWLAVIAQGRKDQQAFVVREKNRVLGDKRYNPYGLARVDEWLETWRRISPYGSAGSPELLATFTGSPEGAKYLPYTRINATGLVDRLLPSAIFSGAVVAFAAPLLAGSAAPGAGTAGATGAETVSAPTLSTSVATSSSPFSGSLSGITSALKTGGAFVSKVAAGAGTLSQAKSLVKSVKGLKPPAPRAVVPIVAVDDNPRFMAQSIPTVLLILGGGVVLLLIILRGTK